jgi:hypothetical protein
MLFFVNLFVKPQLKLKLLYAATVLRRRVVSITKKGYFCFTSVEQLPEIAVAPVSTLTFLISFTQMPDRSLELAAAALLRWLLPIFKTYVSNC